MRTVRCPKCKTQFDVEAESGVVACTECGQKVRLSAPAASTRPAADVASAVRPGRAPQQPDDRPRRGARPDDDDDDEDERPRRRTRRDEDEDDDVRVRSRRDEDDDDEDDEDERPRPRKKKRRAKPGALSGYTTPLIVLVAISLVLSFGAVFLPVLGLIVFLLACVVSSVAGVWGIVQAFQEDTGVGLMYLFVPFYSLYFLITRWPLTAPPFVIGCCAGFCAGIGMCTGLFGLGLQGGPGGAAGPPAALARANPVGMPAPRPILTSDQVITQALAGLRGDAGRTLAGLELLRRAAPVDARRQEVAQALQALIQDANRPGRDTAMAVLVRWQGKEAAPTLVQALSDKDANVRRTSMQHLGAMKEASASEALAERLTDAGDRRNAAVALALIGPAAETAVAAKLQHDDSAVRLEACRVLTQIGTRASVPALEALRDGANGVERAQATIALNAIARRK